MKNSSTDEDELIDKYYSHIQMNPPGKLSWRSCVYTICIRLAKIEDILLLSSDLSAVCMYIISELGSLVRLNKYTEDLG